MRLAPQLFGAVLMLAGGLVPAQALDQKTLKVVPYADLRNIDPIWTTATITTTHAFMIYDTLLAMDDGFHPQPQMLESYQVSPDGLRYSLTLRPGLKWHDGPSVTARDVVASLRRWAQRDDEGRIAFSLTASLEAEGDRSIVWQLKEPYGQLIDNLAKIGAAVPFIMPERVAKTDGFTQITENIGSGPYKFASKDWSPGHLVAYERNLDYVPRREPASMLAGGKLARVDRVEWRYIPDAATAVAALNAGEVDLMEVPPLDLVPILARNPEVVVQVITKLGSMIVLRPNHLQPPFDKLQARQALVYTIDQNAYMGAMGSNEDFWKNCTSFFYCGSPYESHAGDPPLGKPDLAKAKALLAEAGYKGEPVVVMHPTDHPTAGAALLTAENLKKAGFTVRIEAMDWATLTSKRTSKNDPANGGWSIFHTRWEGLLSNPIQFTPMSGACDKAWFGWFCDQEMERMRLAWSREPDAGKQRLLIEAMHKRLAETVPYVNVGQASAPAAWRKSLDGVLSTPTLVLWNIAKK
ncbi:MAG: ABC transporter substrate-binding protein [Proteobacteria bacterium]|nr:ABC transporter substrate-binding protein [Pseudomonadota bacterium]